MTSDPTRDEIDEATADAVTWIGAYSTKVAEIDHQHRRIIDLVHVLELSMGADEDAEVMAEILVEMSVYVGAHFSHEEALLERAGYPQLPAHRALHSTFTAKIDELQTRLASGETALLAESARFLRRWFVEHILGADAAYVPVLAAAGLTDLP